MQPETGLPSPPEIPAPPRVPDAQPGLEERLGTRWVVWVGGLTLALGGFFMVRYSIEAGLLGPGVRTVLGGLFALALLAAGEWTRRKEDISQIAALPIANIPAILTAAGTAVAFATVYAAYALYGFLVPATAFILLGLVALGTLAAALLHGPALAGLGIVGAFVTPVLVSSEKPDFWALYIYLAIVTAAAFGLARVKLWRWLAVTTIGFALLWTFPGLGPSLIGPHAFHVIAGFILAALLVVCGFMFGPDAEEGQIEPISSGALAAYLLGATLIVLTGAHADPAMITFALLVAGTLFVAWRTEAATAAVAIAAGFVFVVFAEWVIRANPDMLVLPGGPLPGIGPAATDGSVSLHLVTAAIFAAGFGIAGFLAQGRSNNPQIPVIWSAASVFTPLALLVALCARIAHLDRSIPFAILAVLLAAAFAAATEILSKREDRPGLQASIALYATGTLAAMALALTFALEKGWLTIALALMSLGTAWISLQRPIPFLRALAAILAGIVVLRIGYEPRIVGSASAPRRSSTGCCGAMAYRRCASGAEASSCAATATTRRCVRWRPPPSCSRCCWRSWRSATSSITAMSIARAPVSPRSRCRSASHSRWRSDWSGCVCARAASCTSTGAILLTLIAGGATVLGLFMLDNPLIWRIDVGGVVFNLLLLGYALPAVLALLLSYAVAGHRPSSYANTIAAGALVLALAYVTLEIRRLYHGPVLSEGPTTGAEQYTYSIAWLVFGVLLLGVGILFNSQRARLASAVVIALTILKAFLIDMSQLTGFYRALSFMCLGVVLVAIGWLYQRILFRRQAASPPAPSAPGG